LTGQGRNRYEGAVSVAAHLESIVAQQAATIDKLSVEREQYRKLYMELLERCAMLEKGIVVGKKAERFKGQDAQLTLQMLEMLLEQEDGESAAPGPAENDTEKVREHERKKPGRRPLPEHLPRVKIEVLPPEVQRKGLDAFTRIGQEVRRGARAPARLDGRRRRSCGRSLSSARRCRTSSWRPARAWR
jgi:transposase